MRDRLVPAGILSPGANVLISHHTARRESGEQ